MLKTKSGRTIDSLSDMKSYKKLQKTFEDGKNQSLKIGFPSTSSKTGDTDDTGVTALYKATVNNFGIGVYKRPFMAMAYAKNVGKYRKYLANHIGKDSQKDILSTLGVIGEGDVKDMITHGSFISNSQKTIDEKGEDRPLIDSAHMVGSVSWSIV